MMENTGEILEIERDDVGIVRLLAWIDDRSEVLSLSKSVTFNLRLCLEEAAQNIVSHGQARFDLPPLITIRLRLHDGGLCAEVEDHGPAFDPLTVPAPSRSKNVSNAVMGGLGIVLIRRLARDVTYERLGELNRLTIYFDR